jgi:hypothetical protein
MAAPTGIGVVASPGVAGEEAALVGGEVAGAEVLEAGGVGPFASKAVAGAVLADGSERLAKGQNFPRFRFKYLSNPQTYT